MTARHHWRKHQRQQHLENFNQTLTDIAALEGRLMVTLNLDIQQIATHVYGPTYLTPWEKLDALITCAAKEGV